MLRAAKGTLGAVVAVSLVCLRGMAAEQTPPAESKSGWFSRLFESPSWAEAVARVDSPKRAAKLVRQFVRFQEDVGDEWTDGKTTWERGFGDCEDFAAAVVQLCREANLDVDAKILVFSADNIEGHAVAMGTWKGRTWISSNGWFEYVDSNDDATGLVAQEMGWNAKPVSMTPLASVDRGRNSVSSKSVASNS